MSEKKVVRRNVSQNNFVKTRYAAVWTDENLIEIVLEQAESYFKKFLRGSKVNVKVPLLNFITYEYDYQAKGKRGIYFDKEVELSEKMSVKSISELQENIQKMSDFKPFITQIEQDLMLFLSEPKMFREELKYLCNIPEVSANSKKELKELIALPDTILDQKVLDSQFEDAQGQKRWAIIEKHVQPLISKYPSIRRDLMNVLTTEKPASMSFRGGEYIAYLAEIGGEPILSFPICFPEESKKWLPNTKGFHARVLGIVSFTSNPPFGLEANFFLRAVSLLVPYQF